MENQEKTKLKPFISLILSTKIPKWSLFIGLIGSIITMIIGLSIPLLTKELVDGFSVDAISTALVVTIFVVFVLQAVVDGVSTYLLAAVGQKIVARLRETMWFKLLRLPVSYFDKHVSGESVSRVVNDTGIVKDLITQHFPQFITGFI
ncbi:ABC transporter transmembrane domain-containing protein, partial [Oceanobacillus caeni]